MFDFVNVEIGTVNNMTNANLKEAVQAVIHIAAMPLIAMTISIGGYEKDSRDLWEIPETREYIIRFMTLMEKHKIPPTRFLPETVNLFQCCVAASRGIYVERAEDEMFNLAQEVKDHHAAVKRKMM